MLIKGIGVVESEFISSFFRYIICISGVVIVVDGLDF